MRDRIDAAAKQAGRASREVSLVAVSKTFPPATIAEAHAAGQIAFGENYVQEAVDKIQALSGFPLEWHFVGPIQSNKTRPIAEHFQWVHSVDRAKIAERLSAARRENLPPLQVCLQVNVSGEDSKSGTRPEEVYALAQIVSRLPRVSLRGLMAIPEPTSVPRLQRGAFRMLREIRDDISRRGIPMDTLSMGMSDDLEAAIAEGATMVRIGRAIFGERRAA